MSNGHSNAVEHANNYDLAEYQRQLNREIDEYIFHAGRISKTVDLMTEIANSVTPKPRRKRRIYTEADCPF